MKPYEMFINGRNNPIDIGSHITAFGAHLYARSLYPNAPIGGVYVREKKQVVYSLHLDSLPEFLKPQA